MAFGTAGVNTILRDDHEVISNVKSDDRVINTVVRADTGHDDAVSARAKVHFPKLIFHGGLIEAIMRELLNDDFILKRL